MPTVFKIPGNSCCLLLTKDQFCQQLFVKSLVPQHCTAEYSLGRQSSNDKNHKNREQLKLQRLFTDFHAKMATRLIIPRIFIPFISLVLALNVEMSTTIFYGIQDESMSNIGSRTTFFLIISNINLNLAYFYTYWLVILYIHISILCQKYSTLEYRLPIHFF